MKRIRLLLISSGLFVLSGLFLVWTQPRIASQVNYKRSQKILETQVKPSPVPSSPSILPSKNSALITATPNPSPINKTIDYQVPFTSQAPLTNWDNPLHQDGCEEASALMVVAYFTNLEIGTPQEAKQKILEASYWQQKNYQTAQDTSAQDTAQRIIKKYFNYQNLEVVDLKNPQQIINQLQAGNLLVIPMNGQKLGNPNFTGDGPERHMLVVRGYDPKTLEFITNDPGTRKGEAYRYSVSVFWEAVRDYPTGDHEPITSQEKSMIVVKS